MREGWIRFRRAGGPRSEAIEAVRLPEAGDGWSLAVSIAWHDPGQARTLRKVLEPDLRGSRPGGRPGWIEAVRALGRRENREAHAALLALFDALAEAVPHAAAQGASDGRPLLVGARNTTTAVNTLWGAAELLGPECVPRLRRILDRALSEPWTLESGRVRDACIAALADIGTQEALEALLEASRRAPTKSLREQILLVLEHTEGGERMLPSRQAELHVTDHGLSGGGRRAITVHRHVFELILGPDGRVRVVDRDEAATPDAAAARVVAAEARSLRAAYGRELTRIEALLATGRSWPYEEWRRVYLDNPITRAVAARLVWRMEHPGGGSWTCCRPTTAASRRHGPPRHSRTPCRVPVTVRTAAGRPTRRKTACPRRCGCGIHGTRNPHSWQPGARSATTSAWCSLSSRSSGTSPASIRTRTVPSSISTLPSSCRSGPSAPPWTGSAGTHGDRGPERRPTRYAWCTATSRTTG